MHTLSLSLSWPLRVGISIWRNDTHFVLNKLDLAITEISARTVFRVSTSCFTDGKRLIMTLNAMVAHGPGIFREAVVKINYPALFLYGFSRKRSKRHSSQTSYKRYNSCLFPHSLPNRLSYLGRFTPSI